MPNFEDFKFANKIRLLYRLLGIVTVIAAIIASNLLFCKHFVRFDFQKKHEFALENFSINTLKFLESPIDIYVFFGHDPDDNIPFFINDLRNLLKEYRHASPHVRIKFVDTVQQTRLVDEFSLKFGHIPGNSIVVENNGRFKITPIYDLYEFTNGQATGFKGERIISDEILKLSNLEMKKVIFLKGHGEMNPESIHPFYGLSSANELLKQNGYTIGRETLDKLQSGRGDLLIIAAPLQNFTPEEIEKLRVFLRQDGRVLLLLAPTKLCGLEDFLYDWGILADDMIVINNVNERVGLSGDNIIDNFSDHDITKSMKEMQLSAIFGMCQPARIDIGAPSSKKLKLSLLFFSNESTFAKLNYLQRNLAFNSSEDLQGPVPIAVLSEDATDDTLKIGNGKLLVIGNSNFIANNRLNVLGNKVLFSSIVSNLLDDHISNSDSQIIKNVEYPKIVISRQTLYSIGKMLLLIPLFFLLIGTLISLSRKP